MSAEGVPPPPVMDLLHLRDCTGGTTSLGPAQRISLSPPTPHPPPPHAGSFLCHSAAAPLMTVKTPSSLQAQEQQIELPGNPRALRHQAGKTGEEGDIPGEVFGFLAYRA